MASMEGFRGENISFSMKHRSVSSLKQQGSFGNHNQRLDLMSTVNVSKILRYAVKTLCREKPCLLNSSQKTKFINPNNGLNIEIVKEDEWISRSIVCLKSYIN